MFLFLFSIFWRKKETPAVSYVSAGVSPFWAGIGRLIFTRQHLFPSPYPCKYYFFLLSLEKFHFFIIIVTNWISYCCQVHIRPINNLLADRALPRLLVFVWVWHVTFFSFCFLEIVALIQIR